MAVGFRREGGALEAGGIAAALTSPPQWKPSAWFPGKAGPAQIPPGNGVVRFPRAQFGNYGTMGFQKEGAFYVCRNMPV